MNDKNGIIDAALPWGDKFREAVAQMAHIGKLQNHQELYNALQFIHGTGVRKSFLEIGSRRGFTFWVISQTLPKGSMSVSVDLPGAMWGESTEEALKSLLKVKFQLQCCQHSAELIFGDSHAKSTFDRAEKAMPDGGYDLIFLDGDHTYHGVWKDFLDYRPLLSEQGVMMLHDIAATDQSGNCKIEVQAAWREMKLRVGSHAVEFIQPGSDLGLGVLTPKALELI